MKNILTVFFALLFLGCLGGSSSDSDSGSGSQDPNDNNGHPYSTASAIVLPIGDANCPNGGVALNTGFDKN